MLSAVGIAATLLLHLALAVTLLWTPERVKGQPEQPLPTAVEHKALQVRLLPPDAPTKETHEGSSPESGSIHEEKCSSKGNTYLGIGVVHNIGSGIISSAPVDYPAYKAGIREGDVLVEMYRLPSTNKMYVSVTRNGRTITRTITMKQICFRESSQ
jgi:predicted metalloprotease with PDZ domain